MLSVFDFATTHETYAWSWPQNINQRLISISCFRVSKSVWTRRPRAPWRARKYEVGQGPASSPGNAAPTGSGSTTGPLIH